MGNNITDSYGKRSRGHIVDSIWITRIINSFTWMCSHLSSEKGGQLREEARTIEPSKVTGRTGLRYFEPRTTGRFGKLRKDTL